MESKKTQRLGGISAILMAFIYITAFIVYGSVLVYPNANASSVEQISFFSQNYPTLFLLNIVSYVFFGILLAVLVIAIHQRIKLYQPEFSSLASAFGIIWVGLVIASGMIANIGLDTVIDIGSTEPEKAMLISSSINVIAEGLGGGNEVVGGIWVLLISILSYKHQLFSKPLTFIGVFVGIAGVFTIYPLEIFTEIFGLTQIIWFLWIGISLFSKLPPCPS